MEHEWVAIATYGLTEDEIRIALAGDGRKVTLGTENIVTILMCCIRCELSPDDALDSPCLGDVTLN